MSDCPEDKRRGQCNSCYSTGSAVECRACREPYTFVSSGEGVSSGSCAISCAGLNATVRPVAPANAQAYNGMAWPQLCVEENVAHFFAIGDWGGVCNFNDNVCAPGQKPSPMVDPNNRTLSPVADYTAQQLVAAQMAKRAATNKPHFIVSVGDHFYPGGIDDHCGEAGAGSGSPFVPASQQFRQVFEEMYTGPGIDGKEWWGVLGNHDYGGVCFVAGWDQQIYYTWGAGNRWVMPAQYWSRNVQFKDFTVDFYFLDTNWEDVSGPSALPATNICGREGNTDISGHCGAHQLKKNKNDQCAATGPSSTDTCFSWFEKLNNVQLRWLEARLQRSGAEWQVVVTHFPPRFGKNRVTWQRLSRMYGIDLFITGHTHFQQIYYMGTTAEAGYNLGETAWVVTGGGGGITSERTPMEDGDDDAYGFMDMKISKDEIVIQSISHAGLLRNTTHVQPRARTWKPQLAEVSV